MPSHCRKSRGGDGEEGLLMAAWKEGDGRWDKVMGDECNLAANKTLRYVRG